ncbi:reverse transcriptase domain-containing protein [Paraburkholderia denitrificans]|uniref:Reverse transcriptase domain-containing protein n=1 Tax=Paraburkholderia denitrificans TaxID=694025 RepID=A0ABW0JE89_9BURK
MGTLYKKVCRTPNLRKAARAVLTNAQKSTSESTRDEAKNFQLSLDKHLSALRKELVAGTFKFPPAHGVAAKKANKTTRRPIVIAPIKSRVVQRAILDVLSNLKFVKGVQKKWFNFGGVEDGGVAKAIERTYRGAVHYPYYIRTDIKDFFTQVPKDALLAIVTKHTDDPQFDELLKTAIQVELANIAELKDYKELFPLSSRGVAQGSCLSPLLCNLLLHDIDVHLNSGDCMSVRYIDDLIIFAPNRSQAFKRLKELKQALGEFKLDAYDPPTRGKESDSSKAATGETKKGFSFLGCDVSPEAISPGKRARNSLLAKVDALCIAALASQRHLKTGTPMPMTFASDPTMLSTLWRISNTVRAWGAAFSFCTDRRIFKQLDKDIEQQLADFRRNWSVKTKSLNVVERQRLLGMQLLDDTNFKSDFAELVAFRAGTKLPKGGNK